MGAFMEMLIPQDAVASDTFVPYVYLEWLDSGSYDGWQNAEDSRGLTPYRCRTVALLVAEDAEHVTISHTETYGAGDGFKKMYHGPFSIPRRAITRYVKLGERYDSEGSIASSVFAIHKPMSV